MDSSQITADLEGTLSYDHAQWIDLRLMLEEFSWQAGDLLDRLDDLQVLEIKILVFPQLS